MFSIQKQLERTPQDKLSKTATQSLQEELMSCRLKAAEAATANKQLRLRVTELETSAQITSNQVDRVRPRRVAYIAIFLMFTLKTVHRSIG